MENINQIFEQVSLPFLIVIGAIVLFLWFLPAIIAVFLNPKHSKLIAIACIPAGFSLIAWSAVMMWACTGKVVDKYKDKLRKPNEASSAES